MEENKTQIIHTGECINDQRFPVNEIGPELTLGSLYPIVAKFRCGCGEEHFDVNLSMDINFVECYKCREKLPEDIRWCHSSRFRIKEDIQPYTTGNE